MEHKFHDTQRRKEIFLKHYKGRYQIVDKLTDVTCKLIDSLLKNTQPKTNLLPYNSKENDFSELTQLFPLTGFHVVESPPDINSQIHSKTERQ